MVILVLQVLLLKTLDNLFYCGLRICLNFNFILSKNELCEECNISPLSIRGHFHLLLFMHQVKDMDALLKKNKCTNETTPGSSFLVL